MLCPQYKIIVLCHVTAPCSRQSDGLTINCPMVYGRLSESESAHGRKSDCQLSHLSDHLRPVLFDCQTVCARIVNCQDWQSINKIFFILTNCFVYCASVHWVVQESARQSHSQASTVNCQPTTVNHPPLTIHHQPSTFDTQLLTIHYQHSTVGCPLLTHNCRPSTVDTHPSAVHCRHTTIDHLLSTLDHRSSTVNTQPLAVHCQPSTLNHPLLTIDTWYSTPILSHPNSYSWRFIDHPHCWLMSQTCTTSKSLLFHIAHIVCDPSLIHLGLVTSLRTVFICFVISFCIRLLLSALHLSLYFSLYRHMVAASPPPPIHARNPRTTMHLPHRSHCQYHALTVKRSLGSACNGTQLRLRMLCCELGSTVRNYFFFVLYGCHCSRTTTRPHRRPRHQMLPAVVDAMPCHPMHSFPPSPLSEWVLLTLLFCCSVQCIISKMLRYTYTGLQHSMMLIGCCVLKPLLLYLSKDTIHAL